MPLDAVGLILLMVGAAITHARRGESRAIATNVVLILLAAVVAWGRFGPYAFADRRTTMPAITVDGVLVLPRLPALED